MQFLNRIVSRNLASTYSSSARTLWIKNSRLFSNDGGWEDELASSWSTGITKNHFDGVVVGRQVGVSSGLGSGLPTKGDPLKQELKELQQEARKATAKELDNDANWDDKKVMENIYLYRQIKEPGARGSYLKDSEKAEMYKLHKAEPEKYTVERLAKEYRIMRQRVVAILWLKEQEEQEEIRRGEPLDDSVDELLDTFPGFFVSHDREFHVATLPYKPDFKVMPEGWDGTTRDPDEVHYEISKKEDDILYEEFLQRFNFNKMKFENKVKVHKYSRRRPSDGWDFTVEKLGPRGKRGGSGGWKFVSHPDGSTRPLNDMEKMYVKRETPRRRRKILP